MSTWGASDRQPWTVRVVVQSFDFPGTPASRRAELEAIIDSIKIEP